MPDIFRTPYFSAYTIVFELVFANTVAVVVEATSSCFSTIYTTWAFCRGMIVQVRSLHQREKPLQRREGQIKIKPLIYIVDEAQG